MLKKLLLLAVVFTISSISSVTVSQADEFVRGYTRSNGTRVDSHFRTNRDGNFSNNYSTYPNVNPYTGRTGTHHYPSYSSGLSKSPSYSTFGSQGSRRSSTRGW